MAARPPSLADSAPAGPPRLFRWFLWGAIALVGILTGLLIGAIQTSRQSSDAPSAPPVQLSGPAAIWAAGVKPAPAFRLTDQDGKPVSLAGFRGRPVIVTFIDPLCRDFCPLEAKVLNDVVARLPAAARPAIVAVSVNLWGNARKNLLLDGRKWRLPPEWRWGVGGASELASVWKRYRVAVLAEKKTIAGVTIHRITHTEAAYLVDASGHQRALYLWPFTAADVTRSLRQLAGAS